MKNTLKTLKAQAIIASSYALMTQTVFADSYDGSLDSTIGILEDAGVVGRIVPLFRGGLNLAFAVIALICIVKAGFNFIQWKHEENPNEAKNKKTAAINNLTAAAIAASGYILIRVVIGIIIPELNSSLL